MNSLSYHQRDLEERINKFSNQCEIAINHIKNLKHQARGFLSELACEPRELKDQFLRCTRQLDEFMYHVTEFNLSASSLENTNTSRNANKTVPTPSVERKTSPSHSNKQSAEAEYSRTKQTQTLKKENWRESCATPCTSRTKESKSIEKDISGNNETVAGSQWILPPQPELDPISDYRAAILSIDGSQLWLVLDAGLLIKLVSEMSDYYFKQRGQSQDYVSENLCAYFDKETMSYYRAVYITSEPDYSEVFLVDTGEFLRALRKNLLPLHPRFCAAPPLAHLCCLADVDQIEDKIIENRQTEFLSKFRGQCFRMKVNMDKSKINDTSKPPSVFLFLNDGRSINELLVQALASNKLMENIQNDNEIINTEMDHVTQDENASIINEVDHITVSENARIVDVIDCVTQDENAKIGGETNNTIEDENAKIVGETNNIIQDENAKIGDEIDDVIQRENGKIRSEIDVQGHNVDNVDLDEELDYSKCPEYVNAVEAVTGYSNRDEIEICKHYTGGDGCFKGSRCKKRHVMIHPDGWTLDRVAVTAKCRPAALPPPGSWHKVKVTHVDDRCQLYVQFEEDDDTISIADMVDEMTREAATSSPLQLDPAPGELLSARFADDGRYYRARVLLSGDHKAEVIYIDFGNTAEVPLADLRALGPRWCAPPRALPCRLAGVEAGAGAGAGAGAEAGAGAGAASVLSKLALDKTMEAQIIARDYDSLTLRLLDGAGFDVAQQLAACAGVALHEYAVEDDSQRRFHHLPA